jgi:purine-binding chemotaxis protein CheW
MSEANKDAESGLATDREFVTFSIAGRWFGAEVNEVHDVFALHAVTPVPLARFDVAGLINLRGRIVTVIDARARLGLPPRDAGAPSMAIGLEKDGESYGLVVDAVGEVLRLADSEREEPPANLDAAWRDLARGVYRLKKGLLVALDISRMLDASASPDAARAA